MHDMVGMMLQGTGSGLGKPVPASGEPRRAFPAGIGAESGASDHGAVGAAAHDELASGLESQFDIDGLLALSGRAAA